MGGNPPASALLGGGSDGLLPGRGPAGAAGGGVRSRERRGLSLASTRHLETSRVPAGTGKGGLARLRGVVFDGNPGTGEGTHRARLRQAECLGPGAQAELGGRGRLSRCEEEEIENSVGPGVRACVWGWEVQAVPRARARRRVCVCARVSVARACMCVCVCVHARAPVCVTAGGLLSRRLPAE